METPITKIEIKWDNIDPLSTEDIPQIFASLDNQYKRHIDLLKLPVGNESKKLGVSKLEIGSLNIELIPWDQIITMGVATAPLTLNLMQHTNTVTTFTKDFLIPAMNAFKDRLPLPFKFGKDDIQDLKTLVAANENVSTQKTLTINQYNGTVITNNNYYSSSEVQQISSGLNEISLELEEADHPDDEYSEPIEISGLVTAIKWSTRRGQIRTKLPEFRNAKQFSFQIPLSEQMLKQFTERTQIKAKAVIVYGKNNRVKKLELTEVECIES